MAIYKTGTAALAANGTVTGTGTAWNAPLSLIRVGCTIMFLAPSAQLFTVTAINSATSMTVANPANTVIPNAPYTILLSDAISVDGLAQDVAETLRYYQSVQNGFDNELGKKLDKSQNLNDVANKATALSNLGGVKVGDFGLGSKSDSLPATLGGASGFFGSGGYAIDGNSGCVVQSTYGAERRAQIGVTSKGGYFRWCSSASESESVHPWSKIGVAGEGGVGLASVYKMTDLGWGNGFLAYNDASFPEIPVNGAGFQASYGSARRAQIWMGTDGTMWNRFSLQNTLNDSVTPWVKVVRENSAVFETSSLTLNGANSLVQTFYNSNAHPSAIGARTQFHVNLAANNPDAVSDFFFVRDPASGTSGRMVIGLPKTGGTLALQGTSGRDFKKEINDTLPTDAFNRIINQRLVTYVYKDDDKNRVRFGVIAEECEKIAPQYIKHNKEFVDDVMGEDEEGNEIVVDKIYRDRPSIDNNPIVMDLIGCIHELKSQIDNLKAEIDSMKTK